MMSCLFLVYMIFWVIYDIYSKDVVNSLPFCHNIVFTMLYKDKSLHVFLLDIDVWYLHDRGIVEEDHLHAFLNQMEEEYSIGYN